MRRKGGPMYIFYFDSGTSNSRGYLLDLDEAGNGRILATRKAALGSKDVSQTGDRTLLPRGLKKLYDEVLAEAGIADEQISKIYASGMITSPFGLIEIPHALVPFGPKELADAMYPFEEEQYFHRTIHLVPGAKTAEGKVPLEELPGVNNVRGEEIEAIGVRNFVPAQWKEGKYIILFPGSHTHALLFEGDRIIDILSNFSGEVFHAITTATILAGSTRLTEEEAASGPAVPSAETVRFGLEALKKHGFARAAYIVHASKIFDACDNRTRRDMLSAVIVGTVFQSLALNCENKWTDVTRLAVYGDDTALLVCSEAAKIFLPDMETAQISNNQAGVVCSVEGMLNIIREEKK